MASLCVVVAIGTGCEIRQSAAPVARAFIIPCVQRTGTVTLIWVVQMGR